MRQSAASALFALIALFAAAGADEPKASPAVDPVQALEDAVADAIARAEPSVVAIRRDKADKGQETLAVRGRARPALPGNINGFNPQLRQFAAIDAEEDLSFDYGSGVVIGPKGEILTAFHVVQGAARLTVRSRGQAAFAAEVIAADPRIDLVVIAPVDLPGAPPPALRPIALGDASALRKGSFLIALGNPYNAARDGSASASLGILSNLARKLEPAGYDGNQRPIPRQLGQLAWLLQLDAKLNLGMSGGAVINRNGELVGLTTAGANVEGYDGRAGYAIPIDDLARMAIDSLKEGKEVEYGFLGLNLDTGRDPDPGRPADGLARVEQTKAGSPADRAGIARGDQILSVAGRPVRDTDGLILAVNALAAGSEVTIKVRRVDPFTRRSQELDKTLILAKFPVDGEVIATNRPPPWRGLRIDHMSTTMGNVQPLVNDPDAAMLRGFVVITEVLGDSAADRAGLKKGQLIASVDGVAVRTPGEFGRAVAGKKGPVKLATDLGPVSVP